MKKLIAIILAMLMLVTVIACGKNDEPADTTAAETTAVSTPEPSEGEEEEEQKPAETTELSGLQEDADGFDFGAFDDYE